MHKGKRLLHINDLLYQAEQAPEPELSQMKSKWKQLTPVIKILRSKEYTYKQIGEWLTKEGIKCKTSDVSQAYKRYSNV